MPRWVVIGALNDKRVVGFTAALHRSGNGVPKVITWEEALGGHAYLAETLQPEDLLRVESPGLGYAVWNALTQLGGGSKLLRQAEQWRPGRSWFAGLQQALSNIAAVVRQHGLRTMHHPDDLLAMTDKARTRELLEQAHVPIPDGFVAPGDPDTLRQELIRRRWNQVFIKPRWGSSGSGVLAFRRSAHSTTAREVIHTTVDLQSTHEGITWVNRKRQRSYRDETSINALLHGVMSDGAVIERWIPKATHSGGPFDLRLVVIAGRIRQRIARVGAGPITNLHLDGERLELDELLPSLPKGTWERIEAACAKISAAFPRSLMIGIDCLITEAGQPYILEVNGWGDYLPNLLHQGRDTYGAEIEAMVHGWAPGSPNLVRV